VAVSAPLGERWMLRPGVFYAPTTLPDQTFHLGIVDFSAWDLRGAVAWTPLQWLTAGISVDQFVIKSRHIKNSGLSLDNSAASGRVLPSANGQYAMSATRFGMTLVLRK
jgi:long-subunit fatty acid transport protein